MDDVGFNLNDLVLEDLGTKKSDPSLSWLDGGDKEKHHHRKKHRERANSGLKHSKKSKGKRRTRRRSQSTIVKPKNPKRHHKHHTSHGHHKSHNHHHKHQKKSGRHHRHHKDARKRSSSFDGKEDGLDFGLDGFDDMNLELSGSTDADNLFSQFGLDEEDENGINIKSALRATPRTPQPRGSKEGVTVGDRNKYFRDSRGSSKKPISRDSFDMFMTGDHPSFGKTVLETSMDQLLEEDEKKNKGVEMVGTPPREPVTETHQDVRSSEMINLGESLFLGESDDLQDISALSLDVDDPVDEIGSGAVDVPEESLEVEEEVNLDTSFEDEGLNFAMDMDEDLDMDMDAAIDESLKTADDLLPSEPTAFQDDIEEEPGYAAVEDDGMAEEPEDVEEEPDAFGVGDDDQVDPVNISAFNSTTSSADLDLEFADPKSSLVSEPIRIEKKVMSESPVASIDHSVLSFQEDFDEDFDDFDGGDVGSSSVKKENEEIDNPAHERKVERTETKSREDVSTQQKQQKQQQQQQPQQQQQQQRAMPFSNQQQRSQPQQPQQQQQNPQQGFGYPYPYPPQMPMGVPPPNYSFHYPPTYPHLPPQPPQQQQQHQHQQQYSSFYNQSGYLKTLPSFSLPQTSELLESFVGVEFVKDKTTHHSTQMFQNMIFSRQLELMQHRVTQTNLKLLKQLQMSVGITDREAILDKEKMSAKLQDLMKQQSLKLGFGV